MNKNPEYLQDAEDYLVLHEFIKTEGLLETAFTKKDMQVVFSGNCIDVFIWQDMEEEQRSGEFTLLHHFSGADQLDDFKMMELFDVMGVVSLNEMQAKARAEISGKEMADEIFEGAAKQMREMARNLSIQN